VLQDLNLHGNQFTSLPPEIGQLALLQRLDLNDNALTSLPPEIGQLALLQRLDLNDNALTSLPPEIGQLRSLRRLDLNDNALTSLPPEIGQLLVLQFLNLSGNRLTSLPPEIGLLSVLQILNLSKNLLPDPYPGFIALHQPEATKRVLAYLRFELKSPDPPPSGWIHSDVGGDDHVPQMVADRQRRFVLRPITNEMIAAISGPVEPPNAAAPPSVLAPLTGVHSPVDFTVSKGRPIQAKPSADVQPVFDTPVDRRDHKLRLDLCRTTASSLLKMLEQQRFNVREGYSQALRDYIRYLPPNTRKRNLLFADQEARILRDLFAEDAAVLPVDFASRLKATLQAHMALRVFYPVVKRFYDDVRFGRAEPLPIDAADNITALVREAPEIFDPSVGQALADAAPPLPASSATFPPNETRTLEPPPDLLGTLPTEKAQGYLRAGVINRLFAAFQKGEVLNKNAEAWAKMGERLLPYVREVIEWLASFLPGPPT
jgi:Leucine rich repeat